jgi:hypothetical protein
MKQNAQGAIEYLLIIGAAILVIALVIIALTSVTKSGTENAEVTGVTSPLKELINKNAILNIETTYGQNIEDITTGITVWNGGILINGEIITNYCLSENTIKQYTEENPTGTVEVCPSREMCNQTKGYGECA